MHAGCGAFFAVGFRCAGGGKGWCLRASGFSRRPPLPISFSHFFDGWKQTERRGSRVKGARFLRVHRSAAQTLDSTPALGTISNEKRGDSTSLFFFNKFACSNRKLLYSNLKPISALFS
jgi:hypothetical protein